MNNIFKRIIINSPIFAAKLSTRSSILYGCCNVQKHVKITNYPLYNNSKLLKNYEICSYKTYSTSTDENAPQKSRVQKLKKAVTEYGATVIVFHVTISLISLGSAYLLVSMGLDATEILTKIGADKWVKDTSGVVASAGTFALAYAVHKVFAPVRISITLASVPFIVRYLRSRGVLKK